MSILHPPFFPVLLIRLHLVIYSLLLPPRHPILQGSSLYLNYTFSTLSALLQKTSKNICLSLKTSTKNPRRFSFSPDDSTACMTTKIVVALRNYSTSSSQAFYTDLQPTIFLNCFSLCRCHGHCIHAY